MNRVWGVDTLTGLSRTFEVISLTSANLKLLESRVSELDEYSEELPVDELQQLQETAARLKTLQEEVQLLFAQIGKSIHLADRIGDEVTCELDVDGETLLMMISTFDREKLGYFLSTLLKIIAKADSVAVTLYRQFQALISAKYPAYEIDDENPPSYATYGEGHMMFLQDLDNTEESSDSSEMIQSLANWCGEDHSNLGHLRSTVEKMHCELKTKAPAPV
jgi:hypothetical protein